ncbi:GL14882 [Drosophila persimilis]|uniref:GL14882 n=1 Tax=Drosophila persimilis TaxID=7234 RepID=B4H0D2_DROPE|nr:GL14882 [Drosophila persimilis]
MSHETATIGGGGGGVVGGVGGAPSVVECSDASTKVEVIVYTKSDKTLKQNMNAKDETLRKRTSLIIVPQQVDGDDDDRNQNHMQLQMQTHASATSNQEELLLENGNRNSIASMDSNQSSASSSRTSSNSSNSSSSSTTSEDAHAAYEDLQNGNAGPPGPRSISSASSSESTSCSSSVDYSLREQLKNFANRGEDVTERQSLPSNAGLQLLKGIPPGALHYDALLSPQEAPLGRRYAEVSQFKAHGKARTSEPLSSVAIGGLTATPQTNAESLIGGESGHTASTNSTANNNNNNNINSSNNNHNGQQSQKTQQQQQSSLQNGVGTGSSMTAAAADSSNQNGDSRSHRHSSSLEPTTDIDDAVDMAHGGGVFEDDTEALLPKCSRQSRDELSQSRTSLVSSSEGGILAEGETSSEDERDEETSRDSSDNSPPCDLEQTERLLLTHPMWFLPDLQRSGAVHLLQGKEEGTFIVRGSSQPNTMAVSVRLPQDTGPYIEHYLIQSHDNVLSLESSRFTFASIPALIAHYAQCCDELPVQLRLPRVLREANNRKKLSSLALLGQEFWSYASSPAVLGPPTPVGPARATPQDLLMMLLDAKSPLSLTETSGLGTATFFSDAAPKPPANGATGNGNGNANGNGNGNGSLGFFSQAGTPSDTTNSSMSSFTTSGGQHMQLLSPNSVDSVILTMSPVEGQGPAGAYLPPGVPPPTLVSSPLAGPAAAVGQQQMSTFKVLPIETGGAGTVGTVDQVRPQRPKPPNTLNLKPPAPPLRWSKPHSPDQLSNGNSNFTVTTTVTFSMDSGNGGSVGGGGIGGSTGGKFVEVTTPASSNPFNALLNGQAATFQTFSKRLSPEGECKDTLSSQGSSSTNDSRWQLHSSRDSSHRKILSPQTPNSSSSGGGGGGGKSRKSRAGKESQHYKESDILESPPLQYCASALSDKISDYEDVWSHDPSDRASLLTSFKPTPQDHPGVMNRRPDLLAETPSTPTAQTLPHLTPCEEETIAKDSSQQLLQFSGDAPPRSRAGLILTNLSLAGGQAAQGVPSWADPPYAFLHPDISIAHESVKWHQHGSQVMHANQRHSEPLKGGLGGTTAALLLPSDLEKLAGSLDELKQKPQQQQPTTKRPRNRIDHWQLDSSWEFMAKQDTAGEAYDASVHEWQEKENSLGRERDGGQGKKRSPLTVHQIIAKRLPDLNLPELVRCSTPPQTMAANATATAPLQPLVQGQEKEGSGSQKSFQSQNGGCRLSSYDNVFCQNSMFGGIDSAQSDDGTIFSEPWDSSQWDSFLPHDDTTLNSDTIHLSKCRPALSEDDTIVEELSSTKDGSTSSCNQDTLKANRNGAGHHNHNNCSGKATSRPKVATILRNPSMRDRDREVLCHPRNKMNIQSSGPGDSLRAYTLQLAQDPSSTFARNIENFISCTKESREAAPQVVMRNMRQFMSGMKNYLVKHGEGKFHAELESARGRLKADEFLNLDAMLETVMHQLVVLPLREHLYGIFVDYYTRSEDIQLLVQNVRYACEREAADFGIRPTVTPPSQTALRLIANLLLRLQEAELPLDKLELFLCVISTVFDATGCPRGQQLGADDFLPVLVYVVAKCGFVGAEIEAEFMWGLLQPTLLNGEPGYYLTALCSAVQVLKTFMASEGESGSGSLDWRSSCLPACSSVLRVIIPDECNGSLQTRTLPVRPHTTTREVCRIIAHKARITNPQDYALYKLVDGEETLLSDAECPQEARLAAKGKHCMLAYKRIDAKIAWPTTQPAGH